MDSYLTISLVANDADMNERLRACATQQVYLGNAPVIANDAVHTPDSYAAQVWVDVNRYVWGSSPGWAAAWDSALASHPSDPDYRPGADPAVITDGQILSTVQSLTGATGGAATLPEGDDAGD